MSPRRTPFTDLSEEELTEVQWLDPQDRDRLGVNSTSVFELLCEVSTEYRWTRRVGRELVAQIQPHDPAFAESFAKLVEAAEALEARVKQLIEPDGHYVGEEINVPFDLGDVKITLRGKIVSMTPEHLFVEALPTNINGEAVIWWVGPYSVVR